MSRTTFRREIGPKSEMQIKLIDRLRSRLTSSYDMTEGTDRLRNTGCIECYLQLIFRRVLDISDAVSILWPLLKNEWVEMGDPAPPRRRTHGGTGAGVLALVKPLPPKAVAGRQASPATIATGGPMGCRSKPCAPAKPLAARYVTHSKFNRAGFWIGDGHTLSRWWAIGNEAKVIRIAKTRPCRTFQKP